MPRRSEKAATFKFNSSNPMPPFVNWNETEDCCEWSEVGCDDSGRVTSLNLFLSGISGRIGASSALFRLTYLSTLDLSRIDFTTGEIPDQFHRLPKMAYLRLTGSGSMESFPSTLANLSDLVELDLSRNFLTDHIPSFHKCKHLELIELSYNKLTGSLSHLHFQGLTNLSRLYLNQNSLNGTISHHLFVLPPIIDLDLSYNQFSGQIKEISIVGHSNLGLVDLSGNKIGGPVPNFFFHFRSISILILSNNLFSGTFKLNKIQSFPSLSKLSLSNNHLTVDTTNMGSYPNLQMLQMLSCNFYDFLYLRNASSLSSLDLSNNHLRGDISSWVWGTGKTYLNPSFNLLTGLKNPPISPNFSELAVLLAHNLLTGMIPYSFCHASSLSGLDLSFNNLNGSIHPCLIKKSGGTLVLNLRGNRIYGVIPDHFSRKCS